MKQTSPLELMKLERYRARRKERRGWKRRLGIWLWVIVAALVLALVGAARAEAGFTPPRLEGRGDAALKLGGFGASDAVAVGIVMLVIVVLLVRLWWAESADQEAVSTYSDEQWDPYAGDGRVMDDPLNADEGVRAPREAMPAGMTRLDTALIVHACASRVGLIRSIVQGAQRPISDEDQVEALATAERLLGDLRVTLWELRAKFQAESAPQRLEGRRDEALNADEGVCATREGAV